MRQYWEIKERHPDTVLLFRMGDFYETFADDAKLVHDILGITLTKRSNGQAADVALAGFPYHAIDNYLPKLVRAGLRVAICEQLEDPKLAKKLVKRDVVEIVTPGVVLRDQLLDPKRSQYLAAVHWGKGKEGENLAGLAFADISTGEFFVSEVRVDDVSATLQTIAPAELLIVKEESVRLRGFREPTFVTTKLEDWVFKFDFGYKILTDHFDTHSLKGFGIESLRMGIVAAGALLHYLQETQKGSVSHMRKIALYAPSDFMLLDSQTRRNLELVSSMQSGKRDGTLVDILDYTQTPMGARRLRSWLLRPLRIVSSIQERLDAVGVLYAARTFREGLRDDLEPIGDLERISARVATGRVSPRDLIYLRNTLRQIPRIKNRIIGGKDAALIVLGEQLESCADLEDRISKAIVDEPPPSLKDGGVFRDGFNPQLDELRSMAYSGKDWLRNLQQSEAERTGISSLKIGYNKVFGYYLEITNTHKDRVPEEYIRKQTLVNAERYITPELKEYEEKILGAEEQMVRLEAELFQILRDEINERTSVLQQNAEILSTLDALASLAETAVRNRYVRPFVHDGKDIVIEGGRHPVVEQFLPPGEPFIPNDIRLDSEAEQILIITGPNMAGKSVVLRQVGLTVLMAQVGSFVPADKARIGVVDRIFTRVGATDNLAAGESTFLVEMNETANILNSASTSSLILLDEVGRGTSTFDGLSIAWALVEYLHDHARVAARTLFATHYHELNELESRLQRVRNYRIQVQEHGGRVVFLRKLERGSADHSYGIEVARMAGLPEKMLTRAREILLHLESQRLEVEGALEEVGITGRTLPIPEATSMQMSLFTEVSDPVASEIRERVEAMDPDRLTPIDALIALTKLKRLTKDLDQVRSSRDRRP